MIDNENHHPDDRLPEIKGAFDREVARRFDGERLAADHARMIEGLRTDRSVLGWRARTGEASGPFDRVPVPLQWLGLAAAIVAAVVGVRSVYLDWKSSPPVERVANVSVPAEQATRHASSESTTSDEKPERPAAISPPAPIAPPAQDRDHERAQPAGPRLSSNQLHETSPRSDSVSSPPPLSAAKVPDTPNGGELVASPPTIVAERSAARAKSPTHASADGATFVTGAIPSSVVQVRVESQRLLKQNLLAEVRDLPQFQATFVIIRGYGPQVGAGGSGPSNDPGVSGLRNGRPLPGGSERFGGSRDDQHAMTVEGQVPGKAVPVHGDASGARESRSGYFVRAFIGSSYPLAPSEHGYFGKNIKPVTLHAHEAWGTPGQQGGIRTVFGFPSLVAIDGAYLPEASGTGVSEGNLIVAAAGKVYAIGINGEQAAEDSDEHAVTVRLARDFPESKSAAKPADVEIPMTVRNGAVAVLCVPDFLLSGERWDSLRRRTLVCVAVSPRFAGLSPAPEVEPIPSGERGNDPPVIVESTRPPYPDEARALGVKGEVVLEMTVLKDRGVYGVHVVSLPEQHGAELLIEPASSAVRRWQFLPARIHGEPVDATMRTTLTFGPDGEGEK